MPTSFSARFSACTPRPTTPEPESGSRPFSASCTATAGASGPSPRWARGRCSFLRLSSGRRGPPASRRSRKEPMDRMPIQVLFIEDSEIDVELALRSLEQGGFDVSWECVQAEEELKRALSSYRPQAILSDFSMPGFDGMEALRLAKEMAPGVPFIFVSGTIGEERAIEAIRLGATDYVLKDNMRRLGTSVKRALSEASERERVRVSEEERARLVQVLEATSDYVGISEPTGKIIYMNAAGRKLTGAPESGDVGKSTIDVHPQWASERVEGEGRRAAERDGLWHGESALLGADGTEIPVSQVITAHKGPNGTIRFFSTIARDIRDRKAYEERLQYFANYDPLTGLPNRSLLGDRALQGIAHAKRAGRPTALLVMNLDRFKLVNESCSHGAGDTLLRMVADRLRGAVREGDTVARLGADAFAVLAGGARPPRHREHRRKHLSARRRGVRHPAAQRRRGDAPRQGRRAQRLPVLRRGDDAPGDRAGGAGERIAARAGKKRTGNPLSAPGRPCEPPHRRRGSPDALEPPRTGMDFPGAVHPHRGGLRPDPPARRIRARRRLPSDQGLERRRIRFAAARRERFGAAVPQCGLRRSGRPRPARGRARAGLPRARAHRERAGGESRGGGRYPQAAQGPGRADRGGRLRHGLFEPELPVAAADRLPQDRPLVRQPGARERARRGDHAGGHLARAFARGARDRRGDRDRGAAGIPAHAPLRPGAGVSLLPGGRSRGDGEAPGGRIAQSRRTVRRETQMKAKPRRR